jgi:hypothetical protein
VTTGDGVLVEPFRERGIRIVTVPVEPPD